MKGLFSNLFSGYLTVLGLLIIATGLVILSRRVWLLLTGERTEGEIVGHKERMRVRLGDMLTFVPIVRFSARGRIYQVVSVTGGSWKALPIGMRVFVRYIPSDPTHAEIDHHFRMWIAPVAVLGLGLTCLAVAVRASY